MLVLKNLQTGVYNVDLWGYSGTCYSRITKQVEVMETDSTLAQQIPIRLPLITSATLYPNPTNGEFTVEVVLREAADIRLILFEVASGAQVDERTERGQSQYTVSYQLSRLNTGAYVLIVMASNERRQLKMVKN
jgi:hypothetical protein